MKKVLVLLALAGAVWADVTVYSPAGTITGNYTTIQEGVAGNHSQMMMPTIQQGTDCPGWVRNSYDYCRWTWLYKHSNL